MQRLVILFLAVATFSSAANIRAIDPEELQTIWQTAYQETLSLVNEYKTYVRARRTQVLYDAYDTTRQFIVNMTVVAKPYWEHVRQIETNDTADCVKEVNSQLYSYNNTIVIAHSAVARQLQATTLDGFDAAVKAVNEGQNGATAIDVKVKACREAECATNLQKEIAQFQQDSIDDLHKAMSDTDAALDRFYAGILKIQLDRDEFKKVLDTFDDQLTQCAT